MFSSPLTLRDYVDSLSITRGATTLRYQDSPDGYESLHYAADFDRVSSAYGSETFEDEIDADQRLGALLMSTVFVSTYAHAGSDAARERLLTTAAAEGVVEREPGTIYA